MLLLVNNMAARFQSSFAGRSLFLLGDLELVIGCIDSGAFGTMFWGENDEQWIALNTVNGIVLHHFGESENIITTSKNKDDLDFFFVLNNPNYNYNHLCEEDTSDSSLFNIPLSSHLGFPCLCARGFFFGPVNIAGIIPLPAETGIWAAGSF